MVRDSLFSKEYLTQSRESRLNFLLLGLFIFCSKKGWKEDCDEKDFMFNWSSATVITDRIS